MKDQTQQLRILVVEDNTGDFVIVQELITEEVENVSIVRANSFKEAAALLVGGMPLFDTILLDLSLPDKNGEALVKDILRHAGEIPVVILTGFENVDFSIRSIGLGVCDYLLKDELTPVILYKSIVYSIERKKASSELKKSEQQYSDLFHLSPQPMWVYDEETLKFLQVNEAMMNLYGYTEEEVMKMTELDIRPAGEREKAAKMLEGLRWSGKQATADLWLHKKKNGEPVYMEVFSTPMLLNGHAVRSVIANDVTEKNQFEHDITKAIIQTQEEERYEIGGELHDNVCQLLATTKLTLGMLKSAFTSDNIKYYDQSIEYIGMALNEIRNLSHRLAPSFFDDLTLKDSFQKMLHDFNVEKKYKIHCHFDLNVNKDNVSHEIQLNIYRILQEQLRNISKYASATEIDVNITASDGKLTMRISDNGVGFDMAQVSNGIGMANMRRRAELFDGKFEVYSVPGEGCTIVVIIGL